MQSPNITVRAGEHGGISLLQTLTGVLTQLGNYTNGSPATALANFGITLDQTGQLSVNATTFTNAANANFATLLSTLGGAGTGGFLHAATNLLAGIKDPATGILKVEEASVATQITDQQTTISGEQARVNLLQTNLTQQISQADTAIANLESQVSYVTGLFAVFTGANSTQSMASNPLTSSILSPVSRVRAAWRLEKRRRTSGDPAATNPAVVAKSL